MGLLGAVGAAGHRNGKYCEGLLTSGQGLLDKVGLITLLVLHSVQSEELDLNL